MIKTTRKKIQKEKKLLVFSKIQSPCLSLPPLSPRIGREDTSLNFLKIMMMKKMTKDTTSESQ